MNCHGNCIKQTKKKSMSIITQIPNAELKIQMKLSCPTYNNNLTLKAIEISCIRGRRHYTVIKQMQ